MMDIAAGQEEINRWRVKALEESATGRVLDKNLLLR